MERELRESTLMWLVLTYKQNQRGQTPLFIIGIMAKASVVKIRSSLCPGAAAVVDPVTENVKGRFLCKHGCNFVSNHTILSTSPPPTNPFRLNK